VLQVYAETTASRTFRNTLADMLGVVRATPACLERVDSLLHAEASGTKAGKPVPNSPGHMPSSYIGTRMTYLGSAGNTTEEGISVVNTLMDVLACDSPAGVPSDLVQGASWHYQRTCRLKANVLCFFLHHNVSLQDFYAVYELPRCQSALCIDAFSCDHFA
jgi:hypothetical protein